MGQPVAIQTDSPAPVSLLILTQLTENLDIAANLARIAYVDNHCLTKNRVKRKMKKEFTEKQQELIKNNVLKNCDYFTYLTAMPDFMAKVKELQEEYELPITPDNCSDPRKRVCSALTHFRFKKLPELVLEVDKESGSSLGTKSDLDMTKVHATLRLMYKDQIKAYRPTEETGVPSFLVPPVTGSSATPPSQLIFSGFKFMLENFVSIARAFKGEKPLPLEMISVLERRGFPYYDRKRWQRLGAGQGPEDRDGTFRKQMEQINPTKNESGLVLYLYTGSWSLYSSFLEQIKELMNEFSLGSEWLWTLYVFLVTDVSPIHICCIPFLNVGISNKDSKDKFHLDIGRITTSRDIQLALSVMQKLDLKSAFRNYSYKTLRENLRIEELSKEKPRVRREKRQLKEEAKEEARRERKQFDGEDDSYYDHIHGPETDKDIAIDVFPDKADVSDEQLKKEADRVKHRRYRHKKKKNKGSFGPSSDPQPGD